MMEKKGFADLLLSWYDKYGRELPWRQEISAYRVLLSEVMLQQTRVETVKPYFFAFLKKYPDFRSLALADDDELMKMWEGLGYYSRARNLKRAAICICEKFGGEMPSDFDSIRSIPGIGPYTAGAISAFVFGLPRPAVDGNVMRIFARLLADPDDITNGKTRVRFEKIVSDLIPNDRAGAFDQALIELGQTVCVPKNPRCAICPVSGYCQAFAEDKCQELPYRAPKAEKKVEKLTVFLLTDGKSVAISKRSEKGLLSGLWQFPNQKGHLSEKEAIEAIRALGFEPVRYERLPAAVHLFTHVRWEMIGYSFLLAPIEGAENRFSFCTPHEIKTDYAIPSAFSAYLPYLGIDPKKRILSANEISD